MRSCEARLANQQFPTFIHQIEPQTLRWLALEGLRGLAVFLVFVVHYTSFLQPHMTRDVRLLEITAAFARAGQSGVDLFFLLSGLLIYRSCIQENFDARKYARRRLVRIYPTFLFVLALYICTMLTFRFTSKLPGPAGRDVLYIFSNLLLLPGLFPIVPIITVAWSLSYELLYYIAMPVLRMTLRLDRWTSLQRAFLAFAAASSMIVSGMLGFGPNFAMIMFPAGIIVYEIRTGFGAARFSIPARHLTDFLVLALVMLALLYCGIAEFQLWPCIGVLHQNALQEIVVAITFSLLVYRCLFERAAAYSVFSWRPLRWLGKISYSFYLFHGFVLHACFQCLNELLPNCQFGLIGYLLLLTPVLLASIALTWPLFAFVERPFSLAEPTNLAVKPADRAFGL